MRIESQQPLGAAIWDQIAAHAAQRSTLSQEFAFWRKHTRISAVCIVVTTIQTALIVKTFCLPPSSEELGVAGTPQTLKHALIETWA